MSRPTKVVVNCETGVQEVIELTDAEIAELEAAAAQAAEAQAAAEAEAAQKAIARQALLDKLGITQEEAALLLS